MASPNPTWDSFFSFLGEVYEKALLKKQFNDSCKQNLERGTDCNISENSKDNFCANLVKQECFPICNDGLHTFEMPSMGGNKVVTGRRLLNCDQFYYAAEGQVHLNVLLREHAKVVIRSMLEVRAPINHCKVLKALSVCYSY